MKKTFFFVHFIFLSISISQNFKPEDYFPFHLGDVWEYYTEDGVERWKITKDSVANEGHYLFYNYSSTPKYLVDTLNNVIKNPFSNLPWVRNIDYNLKADSGETWIVFIDTLNGEGRQDRAYVNDSFETFIFGEPTKVREIHYFGQMYGDTSKNFGSYLRTDHLAAGYGLVYRELEGGTTQPDFIAGVIINGDTLGFVSSIKETNSIPKSLVLYKNYPNPFNNITYINFVLRNKAHIILNVYNILGIKIAEVKNEELLPGFHKIPFNAKNLTSGEYFYTLATKKGTWVGKMLFIK